MVNFGRFIPGRGGGSSEVGSAPSPRSEAPAVSPLEHAIAVQRRTAGESLESQAAGIPDNPATIGRNEQHEGILGLAAKFEEGSNPPEEKPNPWDRSPAEGQIVRRVGDRLAAAKAARAAVEQQSLAAEDFAAERARAGELSAVKFPDTGNRINGNAATLPEAVPLEPFVRQPGPNLAPETPEAGAAPVTPVAEAVPANNVPEDSPNLIRVNGETITGRINNGPEQVIVGPAAASGEGAAPAGEDKPAKAVEPEAATPVEPPPAAATGGGGEKPPVEPPAPPIPEPAPEPGHEDMGPLAEAAGGIPPTTASGGEGKQPPVEPPAPPGPTQEDVTFVENATRRIQNNEELSPEDSKRYLDTVRKISQATPEQLRALNLAVPDRRQRTQEEQAVAPEFRHLTLEQLQANIGDIQGDIQGIREAFGRIPRPTDEQYKNYQEQLRDPVAQLTALRAARTAITSNQNIRGNQVEDAQARQEARREYEELRTFAGKTSEELTEEISGITTGIRGMEDRLDSAYARGDLVSARAIETELDRARSRIASAESIKTTKEDAAKKKKVETDAEEAKEAEKKLTAARRAAKSPPEIESDITKTKESIKGKKDEIDGYEEQLKGTALSPEKRAEIQAKKNKAIAEETELRDTLNREESALVNAKEKKAKEGGLRTGESLSDLDDVSKKEYRAMSGDQKSDRLTDITRVLPAGPEGASILASAFLKMSNGDNLSQVELAMYAREIGDRWIGGQNRKRLIGELQPAITKYPELKKTILDRIEASKAIDEFKNANPSRWERMKKVGKDHKGWFMILLILAGAMVAAAKAGIPTDVHKR